MPDIGLLQGPPRQRLVVVPAPVAEAAPGPAEPPAGIAPMAMAEHAPLIELAGPATIRVAAHAAVVSQPPVATLRAEHPVEPATASIAVTAATRATPPVSGPAESAASPAESMAAPAPARPAPNYSVPPIKAADLLWLLLALAVLIGSGLGVRDPWPADEPRFVSLARDMAQSGEWLFPRVGGDLYQDKPPLFFWMLAACFSLFGGIKAWFLVPALLAAAGVLFLVYDFGRRTVGREAGVGAAMATACSLQFVLAMRGAQIDPVLCLLTTLSIYSLLRHLLLGDGWRWYVLGGFCAGLGVITKGVGFLPLLVLVPFFVLRGFGWRGLANPQAGRGGWRWWLAPLAMLIAISLWFVPMLIATHDAPAEYQAYRDEILFKQTVGRYAAAWHHVRGWHYFLVEVIPALWLPWSLLLFWLVPGFKAAYHRREGRVWLPLIWVLMVLLFFSMSPGKRGIYILPALPVLAMASLPLLSPVLARRGVRIAGFTLGLSFFLAALAMALGHAFGARFAVDALADANLTTATALYVYLVLCGAGLAMARWRAPLLAWPVALGSLTLVFSVFLAPAMNGERSGRDFVQSAVHQVLPHEQLGLVAYKEQFLLYLDRPTVNFGHRRWQEGPQEYFDAAAWLNQGGDRVLLVPEEALVAQDRSTRQPAIPCFTNHVAKVGRTSGDDWFLVRPPAEPACAALGDARRAIRYP